MAYMGPRSASVPIGTYMGPFVAHCTLHLAYLGPWGVPTPKRGGLTHHGPDNKQTI
jgi:hypothetical protein